MIQRLMLVLFFLSLNMHGCFVVAATQSSIGNVISAQGLVVAIDRSNQRRSLQRRSIIYLHDKIVTQQDSKVQFRLLDDSVIVVQPASEFYVSDFSFDRSSPNDNKYVGNIVKGALINISGKGETKNYEVRSRLTTIAFRGTELSTKLVSNGAILNQEVYVSQGYVTVSNKCENAVGICEPNRINIGAGQQFSSATINAAGKIQGVKNSVLLEGCGGAMNKTVTKQNSGAVSIKCK